MLALAERGDLGGMSFGFQVSDESRDGERRTLRALDLFEISVVAAFPAYDGTTVSARAALIFPGLAHAARAIKLAELR